MPLISPHLALMESALFQSEPMGLRARMLATPLAQRFEVDAAGARLFINFEGLAIHCLADIDAIERQVGDLLAPLAQRVAVVVNYDNFHILPALVDPFGDMVARLTSRLLQQCDPVWHWRFSQGAAESAARIVALKPCRAAPGCR